MQTENLKKHPLKALSKYLNLSSKITSVQTFHTLLHERCQNNEIQHDQGNGITKGIQSQYNQENHVTLEKRKKNQRISFV